jgi:serine/threonine protein kinase
MADHIRFEVGQSIQAVSREYYRTVQLLGTGGNAATFLMICSSGKHEGVLFALKVFRKLSQPQRRERFLAEVDFLQRCEHPSIMKVFDRGVFCVGQEEYPFVVAEYLPKRLFDVIRSNAASTTQKISYALQLLSGLAFLESLNPQVVHRDIKPQNVFVKGGSCVLGDFGLMKLLDGNAEEDREIFKESIGPGMPFLYRTPDLIAYARNDADITVKSDVFQLGLVLAELFTGRNPAKRPRNILDSFQMEMIGNIPGGLSGGIVGLLDRMLKFDPTFRTFESGLFGFLKPQKLFNNRMLR